MNIELPPGGILLGLGCDVIEVARVRGVVERQGERFLARVFTDEDVKARTRLDAIVDARLGALVAKPDPQAATALVSGIGWLNPSPARQNALKAKLAKIATSSVDPRTGRVVTAAAATSPVTPAPANPANPANLIVVSRAEYARFAAASGRPAADCGRKLFGRRPRWDTVGSDAGPVACVSAADAQAYASWRSAQERKRYRLPSAGELRAQPRSPIAGWLTLCANRECSQRMASGKPRALDAGRGFEDVGIRLVRAD